MDTIGTGFRNVGDKLVIKLSVMPKLNTKIYAESGDEVGKLVDIIGPVETPMGVVKTNRDYELQGKSVMIR